MIEIELARLDPKEIAGSTGDEPRLIDRRRGERLTQPRDVVAQRVVSGIHTLLREQLLDQPRTRYDAVRAQQEQREQRALLRSPNRDQAPVHSNGERTEDPELEAARSHCAQSKCPPSVTSIPGVVTALGHVWGTRAGRFCRCSTRRSVSGPALPRTSSGSPPCRR